MKILITFEEIHNICIYDECNYFCENMGYSKWVINEGGGDIVTELSEE